MPTPLGYLTRAATPTGLPVLVLHAWWGLNTTIRATCDRLAAAGHTAFAPDLYHGQMADQIPDAERLAGTLEDTLDQTRVELAAAVAYLIEQANPPTPEIAVIGFSLGAFYALDLSANHAEQVAKVVVFYGAGPADFAAARAAYLGHFAENDPYEPQENLDWLTDAITTAGRSFTVYQYPGTGHWFFEPDRPTAYHPAAADLAWQRTLAFLQQPA